MDPNFGIVAFSFEDKEIVKRKIHALLLGASVVVENTNTIPKPFGGKTATMRNSMHKFYKEPVAIESDVNDKITCSIEKYIKVLEGWEDADALNFW